MVGTRSSRSKTKAAAQASKPPPPPSPQTQADSDSSSSSDEEAPEMSSPALMPPPPAPRGRRPQRGRGQAKVILPRRPIVEQRHDESSSSQSSAASDTSAGSDSSMMRTTSKTGAGVDAAKKKVMFDFITNLLQDVQTANAGGKRTAFKAFQREFYKERSPKLINEHQKYFAQTLWRISIVPFYHPHSPPIEQTLKFLYKIFETAGTEEDKAEMKFTCAPDIYPMFFYILKLINLSHMESRQLVRLRIMEAANQILKRHHNHKVVLEHPSLRKDLLSSFSIRLRDKYAPVRVLSATMLRYFADDSSIVKDLKYYARFDPSNEVRKAAISSLKEIPSTKAVFFYEHAFDPSDSVKMEAIAGLASRPIKSLSIEKREKVVYWGLTHPEGRIKKWVCGTLLPAWFGQCGNNAVEFLKYLGVTNKTNVAFTVLQNLYGDNFTETFDSIDRSFLNENRLIPPDKMSLESVIFWMFLIKKFGNVRYNAERLVPAPDQMAPYIQAIIDGIHTENQKAQTEGREEDVTLLMCLGYILSLAVHVGLEEGNRRVFEDLLRKILLDPILDEAPLVKSCVDLMKKIVEPHLYAEKMMLIFQEVFEPSDPTVTGTPHRSRNSRLSRPLSQLQNHSKNASQPMELDRTVTEEVNEEAEPEVIPATPPPPAPPVLTEQDLIVLKDKACSLAMQRLRLGEQKATAIKTSNFLEAHRLQELIDAVLKEETDIRTQIITPRPSLALPADHSVHVNNPNAAVSHISHSSKNSTTHGEPSMVGGAQTPLPPPPGSAVNGSRNQSRTGVEDEMSQIPASQSSGVAISELNMLKGLVMVTRFLSLHPKLTPFVRQLYENHIVFCLTEEDARVRMYTLHLLCMIALIEGEEKRKIMALMLRALEADADTEIKSVAFKGIVDLLLKYRIEDFMCKPVDDIRFDEMPAPYNNPEATIGELEEMFVVALDKYADEEFGPKTAEAVADKVLGMIKLLQVNRIVSESIVSELLCMWTDKKYSGSAVPFNIGHWFPTYTKLGAKNATVAAKALLTSVKRILNAQDDKDNSLCNADFMKLVGFVTQYISPSYLDMDDAGKKVHEDLALMILNDVLKTPKWTGNVSLVRIISKLSISSEQTAKEMTDVITQISFKIATFPQTSTVTALQVGIRNVMKGLNKRFDNLGELPDIKRGHAGSDSSDDELGQPNVFSDSDSDKEVAPPNASTRTQKSDETGGSEMDVDNGEDQLSRPAVSESGSGDEESD